MELLGKYIKNVTMQQKLSLNYFRSNITNSDDHSDNTVTLNANCNNRDSETVDRDSSKSNSKIRSPPRNNEGRRRDEVVDSITDTSAKVQHNKLSELRGQKRLALSPPISSSVAFPSSPEQDNGIEKIPQKLPNPSARSFIYSRVDNPEPISFPNTNTREAREVDDSDEEREEGEVSFIK